MTLIKSISGIRGTIGGQAGDGMNPLDLVKFTAAFAVFIRNRSGKNKPLLLIGRDARGSGEMVNQIVCGTLLASGVDVADAGLSTTPTIAINLPLINADGGIIITASHNPSNWNALKLLNEKGEFINANDGNSVVDLAEKEQFEFVTHDLIGVYTRTNDLIDRHIELILQLPLVDVEAIRKAGFSVVIDAVNSTGGIAIPRLLKALGVDQVHELNCKPDGNFSHNPEPLPAHLTTLSDLVISKKASMGFAVDPDVDRLAIVDENGAMFGEEYTLVAIADYVLQNDPGSTVSNLSSSRALRDITLKHGRAYYASAVGEVNVVEMMKATNAVIGGEGNGGVIYPASHYVRDALVGVALFLTHLAKSNKSCAALSKQYPRYAMMKDKFQLSKSLDMNALIRNIAVAFKNQHVNTIDGVKIDFVNGWVHVRKSNTEPILRIYAEASDMLEANQLADKVISVIGKLTK